MAEVINGYTLITDWTVSSGSATAFAMKNERKFFIKKYAGLMYPVKTESISEKVFEKRKASFDAFMEHRKRVNRALSKVSCLDGNIVYTVDFFINPSDNRYIEVNAIVEDLCTNPYKLKPEEKDLVMKTAAGALSSVHSLNLVHGDLKMTNIIIHKNEAKNYVTKLIDFDCSYFEDSVPTEEIGGDQVFLSPEAGLYMMTEQDPEYKDNLTTKSDIFSLGLIFHMLLTNKMPEIKEKPKDLTDNPYLFEVLLNGGRLEVNKEIKGYLRNIIEGMLQLEPEDRPTALEVLTALKDKANLGGSIKLTPEERKQLRNKLQNMIDKYLQKDEIEYFSFVDELKEEHKLKYDFDQETLKKHKIVNFKLIDGKKDLYKLVNIFGKEIILDEKMLVLLSILKMKGGK